MFFQQMINGITLGSIYALIALGYTMVYGILLLINFAHSEIFMLGAYFGILFFQIFKYIPSIYNNIFLFVSFVFLCTMLATGLAGIIIELAAYRPLRKAPRLAPLISAIGVSIFLQNLVMLIVGPESQTFPLLFKTKNFNYGGISFSTLQIFIIITTILLLIILNYFVYTTRLGKAIRATSQDKETAQLMGINVNAVISLVFLIGAALGGAAGILSGMYYGSVKYNMGFIPAIKSFTAAVVGGIGNITGAMLGGFFLGIIECLSAGYISSTYKDVFAFIILIIVLIFKPSGLLGKGTAEKV